MAQRSNVATGSAELQDLACNGGPAFGATMHSKRGAGKKHAMVLKPRFWGFWTAVAIAVLCIALAASQYARGDHLGDLDYDGGQALFAGLATLLGALAYRSAKHRKLSDLTSHRWQRPLELVCLLAPLLFIARQDDPVAVIQVHPLLLIVMSWMIIAYVAAATGTTQRRTRRILRSTLVIGTVALAAYAAAGWYQDRQLTKAMSRPWPLLGAGIASIPSRFPLQRKTAKAFEAEKIALSLGVSMVPRNSSPESGDQERLDAVRGSLNSYINGALIQSTTYVGPPPDDLAQYLDFNKNALDDLRDLLLSDALLAWEVNVTDARYFLRPPVNLGGHITLYRLLVASALFAVARGDDERASTFLRAAMSWSASLRRMPELISRLIYVAESRDIVASVLKLPVPYPDWFVARPREDMRSLLSESMAYEHWLVVRLIKQPPRFRFQDDFGQSTVKFDAYGLWRWALRPTLLQSQRHTIDMDRATLEEFIGDADCATDSVRFDAARERRHGMWLSYGIYFGVTTPVMHTTWGRVQNFRLLTELASVLEHADTHLARRYNLSSVCRAMSWIVDSDEDGFAIVRLVSVPFLRDGVVPSRPAIVKSQMVPSLEHAVGPASLHTAIGSVQVVQNGGFEEADDTSGEVHVWSLDGSTPKDAFGRSMARQPAWVSLGRSGAYEPHDGRWFVLLNSIDGKEGRVSQTIRIPRDGTTALLTFWLRVDATTPDSVTGYQDTIEIRLTAGSTSGAILDVISVRNAITGSYERRSYRFNVAPWRNQNLSLQFVTPAATPGIPATAFLLDGVTMEVQP